MRVREEERWGGEERERKAEEERWGEEFDVAADRYCCESCRFYDETVSTETWTLLISELKNKYCWFLFSKTRQWKT